MVSDLPSDNVIFLKKDEDSGECIVEKRSDKKTFASNIHNLFADGFFMKSTIGEFAREKIIEVINILNSKEKSISSEDRKYINSIIDIIGEPIIAGKLKNMLAQKTMTREEEIEALQKRLDELNNNQ